MRVSITCLLIAACLFAGQAHQCVNFDRDWLFALDSGNGAPGNMDNRWRMLDLPHDWSIEGDFNNDNPSGAGGGALPGGTGYYRKVFTLDELQKGDHYLIRFDGVYMNSTVTLNGHELGTRPYGYIWFEYDLTPYLNRTGRNVLEVKVDNSRQPNSRWYSGSGIYRHVWLITANDVHVATNGTFIRPKDTKSTQSQMLTVNVENNGAKKIKATVTNRIVDPSNGQTVYQGQPQHVNLAAGESQELEFELNTAGLKQWSIEQPNMYRVVTEVKKGRKVVDTYETPLGLRTIEFNADKGFFLNGKNVKINGVCEHHDLGCLGAAFHDDAMYRKLLKLKAMGVNAIRCTHNPPAPQLLDMCDTMGLLVMDEAFDMWRRRKTTYDYSQYFDQWHQRDLTDHVVRDRNHPSIVMWSIGNEVLEQWPQADADTLSLEEANLVLNFGHKLSTRELSDGALLTRHLVDLVHQLDPTRPVTAGCNEPKPNNQLFLSGALDIIGYNYQNYCLPDVPKQFPGKPFIITESVSALTTRSYYRMPSDSMYIWPVRWDIPFHDDSWQCSSYDNCHVPWGSTQEETWDLVKHNDFVSGQFLWTGFDYIGEPTPYGYPAHSSYFGLIDLCGFPKDTYYMYQSEWNTDETVLHLFPHWNWHEGDTIDLWCYYNNADEVELLVNGKSQGVKSKTDHVFHTMWRTAFEPGEITAISRKGGRIVAQQTIKTAGEPARVRLSIDHQGQELTFINVEVTDRDGNLCPWADNDILFNLDNDARIMGVDNGCQTSLERYVDNHRKAFYGKCAVVLKGHGTLHTHSQGLQPNQIEF